MLIIAFPLCAIISLYIKVESVTTKTSSNKTWFKGLLVLPILAILIFGFSTKEEVKINQANLSNVVIQEGASKDQIKKYNKLARHYNAMDQSHMEIKKSDLALLKYL